MFWGGLYEAWGPYRLPGCIIRSNNGRGRFKRDRWFFGDGTSCQTRHIVGSNGSWRRKQPRLRLWMCFRWDWKGRRMAAYGLSCSIILGMFAQQCGWACGPLHSRPEGKAGPILWRVGQDNRGFCGCLWMAATFQASCIIQADSLF